MESLVKKTSPSFWRNMTTFWSVFLFVLIISDFVANNRYTDIVSPVAAIYVIVLSIYSADKEFERWHALYRGRHPGEVYIGLWTILIVGILTADFFLEKSYKIRPEIVATYIVVLGILAITRKSKSLYQEKNEIGNYKDKK